MKKFLIDVDGVLADPHSLLTRYINSNYDILKNPGRVLTLEDISNWNFGLVGEMVGGPKNCVEILHQLWADSWRDIEPVDPYVIQEVKHILADFPGDIVTANPTSTIRDWLSYHGLPADRFRHDSEKNGYWIYLEDNPALQLGPGQIQIIRDRPWNREKEGLRILSSNGLYNIISGFYRG